MKGEVKVVEVRFTLKELLAVKNIPKCGISYSRVIYARRECYNRTKLSKINIMDARRTAKGRYVYVKIEGVEL